MFVPRRAFLATPLLAAGTAMAQPGFPNRPISVVVPFAPGGGTDVVGRAVAAIMERDLGRPLVVENRAGAATSIGSTYVAQARPDGYTLLLGASSLAINPALQPNLTPRDPLRELIAIGPVYSNPLVLQVHASVPATTVAEFIAYARANPSKINYGSAGIGAVNHLMFAMLLRQAGIEAEHVPYRGGAPAMLDLQSNRIQAMFNSPLEAQSLLAGGVTRALGVSSLNRLALLPDVPAISETLPGFDAVFWMGLFAPAGTPEAITARLSAALRSATQDTALKERLAAQGVSLLGGDGAAMQALLARDTEAWGKVIREAGITVD
ncbi:Bug family tripartite tricarboxylate transporter substrate binding protein [Humitalea sp. 24SJ18S-53]|uniref:Bug family tripartite tricarboxylate transporter substrate binding protein n=1 Tax=Humitalea sp. 24SJ18S-53 TaxID=3422307 RepID=UPI003D667EC0